jgi:protein-S-isoprenylcysteine O-methyltransferase Ste14
MPTSRSTPRLRLTALLLAATVGLVTISERGLLTGAAGEIVQLAGLACIAVAALGRVWTSAFIAGFKDSSLVREGPYSALRHPLYALSMLAMLGVGLATRSVTLTGALLVTFAATYAAAARREDEFLSRAHGESHADFVRRTPAFWPVPGSYRVPESIEVRPRVFWKAFLDAGSMIGLYVLLRLADLAQLSGMTPTLLKLP